MTIMFNELTPDERQVLDNIMDRFEDKLNGRGYIFSQRHRLRWWTARGIKWWIINNKTEKVEFT